jgi:hypothetical protein
MPPILTWTCRNIFNQKGLRPLLRALRAEFAGGRDQDNFARVVGLQTSSDAWLWWFETMSQSVRFLATFLTERVARKRQRDCPLTTVIESQLRQSAGRIQAN